MSRTFKKLNTCHNCGGKTLISEYHPKPKNASFAHVVLKCRTCGAWCGGFTTKIKKPKE